MRKGSAGPQKVGDSIGAKTSYGYSLCHCLCYRLQWVSLAQLKRLKKLDRCDPVRQLPAQGRQVVIDDRRARPDLEWFGMIQGSGTFL